MTATVLRSSQRARRFLAAVLVVSVAAVLPILAGCSGSSGEDETSNEVGEGVASSSASTDATAEASTSSTTAVEETDRSETDGDLLDGRLNFVLGLLAGEELDETAYQTMFGPDFIAQVPYASFTDITAQVAADGPYEVVEEVDRSADRVTVRLQGGTAAVLLNLGLDSEGRIVELLLQPADPPTLESPVEDVDDAIARLEDIGELHLVAGPADTDGCRSGAAIRDDELMALGSMFKLWVLAAVVDSVDAGTLDWQQELTVTDEVRSLPSGQLQNEPEGTNVTVAEAAELMISISDNTATDLLIIAVGRDAVEQAQAEWGHESPEANVPFLTTRELFQLKVASAELQERWLAGDDAEQRAILTDLADQPLPDVVAFTADPIRPEVLEWFASPQDVCRVLARLHERATAPGGEPVLAALSTNPGVPDEDGRWDLILFKGGSEPGLLAASWLVDTDSGEPQVVAGSVIDPDQPIDEVEAVLLLAAVRDLLPIDG